MKSLNRYIPSDIDLHSGLSVADVKGALWRYRNRDRGAMAIFKMSHSMAGGQPFFINVFQGDGSGSFVFCYQGSSFYKLFLHSSF